MANRLTRLLRRRSPQQDAALSVRPAADVGSLALDTAAVGPPMLLPAVIFRQVLFDPTEFTPVWLRPRPTADPAPAPERSTPPPATDDDVAMGTAGATTPVDGPRAAKRPRRAKPAGPASGPKPSSTPDRTAPKRTRKAKGPATDG